MHDIYWQVVHDTHSFACSYAYFKQMCMQLLEDATLIALLPIENIYIIAKFHAGAIPEGIRLFIDTFIKGRERYFEIYQAHSLPCFDSHII